MGGVGGIGLGGRRRTPLHRQAVLFDDDLRDRPNDISGNDLLLVAQLIDRTTRRFEIHPGCARHPRFFGGYRNGCNHYLQVRQRGRGRRGGGGSMWGGAHTFPQCLYPARFVLPLYACHSLSLSGSFQSRFRLFVSASLRLCDLTISQPLPASLCSSNPITLSPHHPITHTPSSVFRLPVFPSSRLPDLPIRWSTCS